MRWRADQIENWRAGKKNLLLPIIYIRGFAASGGEIEETSLDPFNGFNVGSMLLRTSWTGDSVRHIFESPVLRLSQPPYDYRLAFSDGLRGLDLETQEHFTAWREDLAAKGKPQAAWPMIAIYRYYDAVSTRFGDGVRIGMEAYGWGVGRLVLDVLKVTGAPGVYIVAHSMGGLVARTFLQNPTVLDGSGRAKGRTDYVDALLAVQPKLSISGDEWTMARRSVRRLFTYGTPHKGISMQGGRANALLRPLDALLGYEIQNFEKSRMREYLNLPDGEPNSLGGQFPVKNTFCLVGTAASDYPVGQGQFWLVIGHLSDGLVETDNAIAAGPTDDPALPPGTSVLAARAYVRRAHSGPYGMVNSEEGFASLSRFLYGDARVDGELVVRALDLPQQVQAEVDARKARGQSGDVRASYSFETSLRIRGERSVLTERLARDGAAIFRRYDELFPGKKIPDELRAVNNIQTDSANHSRIDLFSVFLDTYLRTLGKAGEKVEGKELHGTLGFAFRLRVAVPEYEIDGRIWDKNHYEGSALLDKDIVILVAGADDGWTMAWGPNSANGTNAQLRLVSETIAAPPGDVGDATRAFRLQTPDALEFWLPLKSEQAPRFEAWLRLTARRWNAD